MEPPTTPALSLEILKLSLIRDWREWRILWDKTTLVEFRHSLLHFGFYVETREPDDSINRLLFYLDIADGHADHSRFQPTNDRYRSGEIYGHTVFGRFERPGQAQEVIARKAFEMLCQRLFKDNRERHSDYASWERVIADQRVIEKLLWFLRIDTNNGLYNIPGHRREDHHVTAAMEFALGFCKFAWDFCYSSKYASMDNDALRNWLETQLPKFVVIADALDELKIFANCPITNYPLTPACMEKLRTLALRTRWCDNKQRQPKTIDEAIFFGSSAARLLLILETTAREKKRLDEIKELERTEREARQRRAELEAKPVDEEKD